ncbi:TetR family transcriptional regulator [Actinoplanes sp. SE50]|uniref:acyl-CoA-like ligand-binding transcription factor n=1 Tax=unclassified Actinoplanes TaxID=2626549 RepID=UPI00023ED5D4|nr:MULTISPECIES: TetR family transcriptional regulator [unclassified Actinoplanes]AEV83945.1 HTH-type transcriptional regulator tcmR [Actinoplanes sp. SE50/110]ATO81911.1 TetR family transcriptional regulator [Actinoplanes sp. SE50]SLL99319.1 TetR family transcriptional regulator [Actinoplanes sp. SE50/110]
MTASLRERKKARTRATIREQAMRLFEEQGYAATTVDQIAEAAEVSPSTFFRYFPAKEDVILVDDYDPLVVAAVRAQPPEVPPIEAIRRALRDVFGRVSPELWELERRRQKLFAEVPELRARALHQMTEAIELIAEVIGERAGLPPDDLRVRAMGGAIAGVVLAVLPPGRMIGQTALDPADFERLSDALDLLQQGLPLG